MNESSYSISIGKSAQREVRALDPAVRTRIMKALRTLTNPRPQGCIKLAGSPNLWRLRAGDWRVLYEIDDKNREVNIVGVRHRSRAYD